MKTIYAITNSINDKVYVGCTGYNLSKRFNEHVYESRRARSRNRPLYRAMNELGVDKFRIHALEECEDAQAQSLEQKWIKHYAEQNQSYNIARGGVGKPLYDHEMIVNMLIRNPYPSEIASFIGCSTDIVRKLANSNGIQVRNKGQETNVNHPKTVYQYDTDGTYLRSHISTKEAVDWCVSNNIIKKQSSGARGRISYCANGKLKSAYGYIWKYQ